MQATVKGGYDALVNVCTDMKAIGLLKDTTDVGAMIGRSYKFFDDVPDSYRLDGGSFVTMERETVPDCCK